MAPLVSRGRTDGPRELERKTLENLLRGDNGTSGSRLDRLQPDENLFVLRDETRDDGGTAGVDVGVTDEEFDCVSISNS